MNKSFLPCQQIVVGNGNQPTDLSVEAFNVPATITATELAGFAASRAFRTYVIAAIRHRTEHNKRAQNINLSGQSDVGRYLSNEGVAMKLKSLFKRDQPAYRFTDVIRGFHAIFWAHKVEVDISCDWYASLRNDDSSNRYVDQRATWA